MDTTVLNSFSKDIRDAFEALDKPEGKELNYVNGGSDIEVCVNNGTSYRRILILKNASCSYDLEDNYAVFEDTNIVKNDGVYTIVANRFDYNEEADEVGFIPYEISFSEAEVKTEAFRPQLWWSEQPWDMLEILSLQLLEKYNISDEYCNQREKALLPLLKELASLTDFEKGEKSFPLLKELFRQNGFNEITKRLVETENSEKRINLKLVNLNRKLCKAKYESIWRELFNRINESQSEYITEAEKVISPDELAKERQKIQLLMHKNGYSGEYPDFYKKEKMKGLRLAGAFGMTYFVGMQEAVYHIHCSESVFDGKLDIDYICGTKLLKKDEDLGDIYSCMFDANGKRFCTVLDFNYYDIEGNTNEVSPETQIAVAIKKAEQKRLSKEEKEALSSFNSGILSTIISAMLLFGLPFGVLMTLGFMLIEVLIVLIFDGAGGVGEIFKITPWWLIGTASAVLSGIAFGVSIILAERK